MKLLKNRKVLAALFALVIAVIGVVFGTDLGVSADEVTGLVCQLVACE